MNSNIDSDAKKIMSTYLIKNDTDLEQDVVNKTIDNHLESVKNQTLYVGSVFEYSFILYKYKDESRVIKTRHDYKLRVEYTDECVEFTFTKLNDSEEDRRIKEMKRLRKNANGRYRRAHMNELPRNRKLTNEQVLEIVKKSTKYGGEYLQKELAEMYGMQRNAISEILSGAKYSRVTGIEYKRSFNAYTLTQEQVDYIRTNYKPRDKEFGKIPLLKRFGISDSTFKKIIKGTFVVKNNEPRESN